MLVFGPSILCAMDRPSIFKQPDASALSAHLNGCTAFGTLPVANMAPARVAESFAAIFSLPCLSGHEDGAVFLNVKRWALAFLEDSTMPFAPLECGEEREFTAAQCRGILANAMLDNCVDSLRGTSKRCEAFSGLDFYSAQFAGAGVGAHKMAALLLYFCKAASLEGTEDDGLTIVFHRVPCLAPKEMNDRLSGATSLPLLPSDQSVVLHDGTMEAASAADPRCTGFVNFANAEFGYGCFIPSATQEEILQMSCPEFNVGMAIIGRMNDHECVNVYGCRRFTEYTGYAQSYSCGGLWPEGTPPIMQDILTLDACMQAHFGVEHQLRDLSKAHAAFCALAARSPQAKVSTGRWGCGVFGGLPAHKFLQQILAARLAGVELRFSTFGSPDGCDEVLDAMKSSGNKSVADAWALLQRLDRREAFQAGVCAGLRVGILRE